MVKYSISFINVDKNKKLTHYLRHCKADSINKHPLNVLIILQYSDIACNSQSTASFFVNLQYIPHWNKGEAASLANDNSDNPTESSSSSA
jgi:hypothetical protein